MVLPNLNFKGMRRPFPLAIGVPPFPQELLLKKSLDYTIIVLQLAMVLDQSRDLGLGALGQCVSTFYVVVPARSRSTRLKIPVQVWVH